MTDSNSNFNKIRQYGTSHLCNFACRKIGIEMCVDSPNRTIEALLGKFSMRVWRHCGRDKWIEMQTKSDGMPWAFHCRG